MADLLFPLIDPQIRERKFQQREIDLDELTDKELRSRYRFGRESIKFVVEILKDDLPRGGGELPYITYTGMCRPKGS